VSRAVDPFVGRVISVGSSFRGVVFSERGRNNGVERARHEPLRHTERKPLDRRRFGEAGAELFRATSDELRRHGVAHLLADGTGEVGYSASETNPRAAADRNHCDRSYGRDRRAAARAR
jgi:hypothetical protein